jgi:hypothetical protein
MKIKKGLLAIITVAVVSCLLHNCKGAEDLNSADVVIYGGTSYPFKK